MVESDIRKNNATDHHEKHDGAIMPGAHSGGSEHHIPDISHEEEHEQEEHKPAERNIAMKDKISPTIIGLVMTLIGIATLGAGNTVEAASINSGIADYSISAEISIDNIEGIDTKCIDTIEAATIETNAITDNIGGKAINDGIYTEIVDNTIGEGIPVEGIAKTIPTNILKNNSINITIEKEDIAY